MRALFFSLFAAISVSFASTAAAREPHIHNFDRSYVGALLNNDWPTVLLFVHGGLSPEDRQELAQGLSHPRYRWAHVVVIDVDAAPSAAMRFRRGNAPSFAVVRGGEYVRLGEGQLGASQLRAEMDRALASPISRVSVD